MTVTGAHAVITGGSSGIGEATALELARRGARVTLLARDPDRLRAAADRIEAALGGAAPVSPVSVGPVSVGTVSVDVADREAVVDGFGGIVAERGEVDVLVTSAGITRPGRFTELSDEVFTSMIDVDYYGTLWPIRAVVPSMIRRGSGSIVAVSSAAAIVGIYGYSAYGAAKFAVRGLTESLRYAAGDRVRITTAHPVCTFPAEAS